MVIQIQYLGKTKVLNVLQELLSPHEKTHFVTGSSCSSAGMTIGVIPSKEKTFGRSRQAYR